MRLFLNVSVNPSCLGTWQEICQIPGFASQYLSNLSKSGSMANSIKTVGGNFLQYQNKIYFLDIYPCLFKLEILTWHLTFGMWKYSDYKLDRGDRWGKSNLCGPTLLKYDFVTSFYLSLWTEKYLNVGNTKKKHIIKIIICKNKIKWKRRSVNIFPS